MTSISKNVYIDKLTDIMRAFDVNSNTYINFNKEKNKEDPKFEVADM